MDITRLSAYGQAALREIQRAQWKSVYVLEDQSGNILRLTEKQFASSLKPAYGTVEDQIYEIGISDEDVTPAVARRVAKLFVTPKVLSYRLHRDGDEYLFDLNVVENAKLTQVLSFGYDDYPASEVQLTSDGNLTIGCQTHPLDVWEAHEQYPISGYVDYPKEYRTGDVEELVPLLRERIAEVAPKRKRAKKAA